MLWALGAGGLLAAVLVGNGWTGTGALVVGGAAAFVFYWIESRIWKEVDCWFWLCERGVISWSPFTPGARRRCFVCGGSGRRQRTLSGGGS